LPCAGESLLLPGPGEEPAAPTSVALATLPEEITDLASQVPELEQLLAALGIVDDEVERPAE